MTLLHIDALGPILSGLVTKILGMEIYFILFPKVNNKKGIENKTVQCVYICTFSSQLQTVYKETKLFKIAVKL